MNHTIKHRRAQRLAGRLPMANAEIWSRIPDTLKERLTGSELAEVIKAMDVSYHAGKASAGAEVVDASREDGAVYINGLGMIEWKEIGAEYETVVESNGISTIYRPQKIKNGEIKAAVKF